MNKNKKLPKTIVRASDGEEFILNENGKYNMRSSLPAKKLGRLVWEWSYETLMDKYSGEFHIFEE